MAGRKLNLTSVIIGMATAFVVGVIGVIVLSVSSGVPGDTDADGYSDDRESGVPLCIGTRNEDAHDVDANTLPDTVVNDGCPGGPAQFGSFSEAAFNVGTSPTKRCGDNLPGGPSQNWPPDLSPAVAVDKLNLVDISSFTATPKKFNTKPGDVNFDKRWDLVPGPVVDGQNWIVLTDMSSVTSVTPPMAPYYGTVAFGGPPCIRHEYQPTTPAQGAFFYSWFPNTWAKPSISRPCTDQVPPHNCYTVYSPALGFYDATNTAVIDQQLALLKKAHQDFVIGSWFGPGDNEDAQLQAVMDRASLSASPHLSLRLAAYYEDEGTLNPSASQIASDLAYLNTNFFGRENYLEKDGQPVVFAYGGSEACEMTQRWADAEASYGSPVHVVLKVFPGSAGCPNQPDGWHQYGPATAVHSFPPYSTTISPGYTQLDNTPYLARDVVRFEQGAEAMVAAGNTWQLVTSWNEWGEGHSVEPASEFGEDYISALCRKIPASPWMPACSAAPAESYLIGAGDIAECGSETGDELTGDVIEAQPSSWIPFTLGDNAYDSGTAAEFTACYEPAWGSFKARTKAAPGNHEWLTSNAQGYKDYFGPYQPVDPGYYAYDAGTWRVYVLDSDCSDVGGCNNGDPQYEWLEADLSANPRACVLAYWHHPVYTAGPHADNEGDMIDVWRKLFDSGADLVLTSHDHSYQRYARLNRDANGVDPSGLREIIVGTGGKGDTDQTRVPAGLEASADINHTTSGNQSHNINPDGVLKITLRDGSYDWQYMPVVGKTFVDAGREACH